MKYLSTAIALGFSAVLLTSGCASGPKKERTALEAVADAKQRVATTDEYILKADNVFKDFEKKLLELRKEAEANNAIRGKSRYVNALGGFDGRLSDARHELSQLKSANAASWEQYRRKISEAGNNMSDTFRAELGE